VSDGCPIFPFPYFNHQFFATINPNLKTVFEGGPPVAAANISFERSNLDQIWSPWRMAYIQETHKPSDCVFCVAPEMQDGFENLIVFRAVHTYAILNRYPYTSGHLMVVPYVHKARLEELTVATRAEIMEVTAQAIRILQVEYAPQGYNVGLNLGAAAGAGIAGHLHQHIVPRWRGDTNFMTSLSSTRVLPEALEDTFQRLKTAWDRYSAE
jgi:ATP adenylyltransferase